MPVIVNDKFETKGPQTSNSALAFAGYLAGRRLSGANQASRSYQQESNSTTGKSSRRDRAGENPTWPLCVQSIGALPNATWVG
jgi:hypothetical protein